MNKILTSPSSFGKISSEPIEILNKNGFTVINNPYGRKLTEDEVIELAIDCVGIVAGVEPLNKQVLGNLPQLKCISRVGVGMDSIDIEYAKNKGIKILNTPDGPTRAVAELTLGLVLSLLRKIPMAHHDMKNKLWKKQTGNLLFEKKIGILGLGRIGRMTAELFRSIGNYVYGYDINPDHIWANKNNIQITDLKKLLLQSDIITIHVPANKAGKPILGEKELNYLKKEALIINVSRGGVVDEDHLYKILKNNIVKGAAIDVFNEEPYYGKFCELNNVILTPHIGSYAMEGKLKMEIDAVKNIINVLK